MAYQAEQRAEERSRPETPADPPPAVTEQRQTPLFQTLNELRARHGNSTVARERLYLWGGGLMIGSILFGALYLMIHFLE